MPLSVPQKQCSLVCVYLPPILPSNTLQLIHEFNTDLKVLGEQTPVMHAYALFTTMGLSADAKLNS